MVLQTSKNKRKKECFTSFILLSAALAGIFIFLPMLVERPDLSTKRPDLSTAPPQPVCFPEDAPPTPEEIFRESYVDYCCYETSCIIDEEICGSLFSYWMSQSKPPEDTLQSVIKSCTRYVWISPFYETELTLRCDKSEIQRLIPLTLLKSMGPY